jgi:hypothetical protein
VAGCRFFHSVFVCCIVTLVLSYLRALHMGHAGIKIRHDGKHALEVLCSLAARVIMLQSGPMPCKLCVVWLHPIFQLCTRSIGNIAAPRHTSHPSC